MLQQSVFVEQRGKKSVSSDKIIMKSDSQTTCEIECVTRLDCQSYDYSHVENICEIIFKTGDVKVMDGWVHARKKVVPVS